MSTSRAPAVDDHGRSGDRLDSEPNDQEIVDQRNTSTDKLLQLAHAASGSIIQIPADLLTSLLQTLGGLQSSITTLQTTVTDLQSSVIELKKENRGLQPIISRVDKSVQLLVHHGGKFYLFPKLPLEIQRMIWRHSANLPQVIAVRRGWQEFLIPAKPHYAQLGVCKEARNEVSKVVSQLKNQPYTNSPPIFFNSSTDTLWLITVMDNASQDAFFDDLECLTSMNIRGGRLPIKKIALPAKYWYQEIHCNGPDPIMIIMDNLKSLQTEEVLLIVENDFAHHYADDIAFVQHRGTPSSSLVGMPSGYFEWWDDIRSWEDAEAAEVKYLRDFQAERAAERKAYWLTSGIADEDDVDYEATYLHDFSAWSVKRVRFMKATTVEMLRKLSLKGLLSAFVYIQLFNGAQEIVSETVILLPALESR